MTMPEEAGPVWSVLPEARLVGGAVRDLLAGLPVSDTDFATPLDPATVMQRLDAAGIKVIPTGVAHGTVTALVGGKGVEITTLRRDLETDGRHAVVAFTDDWEADAARRDFTINAMSMSRDGTLFDYFDGAADLAGGRVRFVGDPAQRIREDYLRILRFFRFFARYGRGEPDRAALEAIGHLVAGLRQLSAERVWSEIKRILLASDPRAALALMQETGVLAQIFPEGTDLAALNRLVARGAPADPLLRMTALLGRDVDAVEAIAERLKLSNEERERLHAYAAPNSLKPGAGDPALRAALADEPAATLIARLWLAPGEDSELGALRDRLSRMAVPVFPLKGADIVALGVPPGPAVGEFLDQVRRWWLAQGCPPDRAACLARARQIMGEGRTS